MGPGSGSGPLPAISDQSPLTAHWCCPRGKYWWKWWGKKAIGAGNWWKMRNCLQEARLSLKADILIYNHTILLSQYSSLAAAHKSGCTTSPPDIWSEIGDAIISYFHSPNDTSTNIYYLIVWCGMLWCCQGGLYLPTLVLSWYQVKKQCQRVVWCVMLYDVSDITGRSYVSSYPQALSYSYTTKLTRT